MNIIKRVVENSAFIFVSETANRIFSFCFIVYAARVLGPNDFGLFAFVGAVTFFISTLGNFGIRPVALRELAKNKSDAKNIFDNVISIRILLILIAYFILILVINILDYAPNIKYLIYVSGASAIFATFSESFGILYAAFERFKIPSLMHMLVSFLANIANILILYYGYGLVGIFWTAFFGSLLGAIISGVWVRRKLIYFEFTFDAAIWKNILKQSLPYALLFFFRRANRYINIMLLSKIPGPHSGNMAVGYYKPASTICSSILLIPDSFRHATFPVIASNEDNKDMVKNVINKSSSLFLAFIIFPLVLAATFFSEEIITTLFGNQYLPSAPALTILAWAYAFQIYNIPVVLTLTATGKIDKFIPWIIILACLNIVIAIPLIIYYSYIGAAIAFLISKILETLLRNYVLKNICKIEGIDIKNTLKLFTQMVIIISIIYAAHLYHINHIILMVITTILYLIFIIRYFKVNDCQKLFFKR